MGRCCQLLLFADDPTVDKSSRINYKVYRFILCSDSAEKLIRQWFTEQSDNDPKHTAKAQEFLNAKKWDLLQWPSQSPETNKLHFKVTVDRETHKKGQWPIMTHVIYKGLYATE